MFRVWIKDNATGGHIDSYVSTVVPRVGETLLRGGACDVMTVKRVSYECMDYQPLDPEDNGMDLEPVIYVDAPDGI